MFSILRHLRYRPSLSVGMAVAALTGSIAATRVSPVTAALIGWDLGVLAYGVAFFGFVWRMPADRIQAVADAFDEGSWGMLVSTVVAAIASVGAIVVELAQAHGAPHAGPVEALAGCTVVLSWFFIHTIFATHYAHAFWGGERGLSFPGNEAPGFSEFLYFSFCIGVASQVSDVSTQSAAMRKLVLVHSTMAYLFNTAIIALGVNIAASLAA